MQTVNWKWKVRRENETFLYEVNSNNNNFTAHTISDDLMTQTKKNNHEIYAGKLSI